MFSPHSVTKTKRKHFIEKCVNLLCCTHEQWLQLATPILGHTGLTSLPEAVE